MQLVQLDPAVFRNRIGHPLVILRMAVEMGRPELPNLPGWLTEMDAEQRVISIVVTLRIQTVSRMGK